MNHKGILAPFNKRLAEGKEEQKLSNPIPKGWRKCIFPQFLGHMHIYGYIGI